MSAKESIRALARHLLREHIGPVRLGAAVGVGVLVGCSPFFGLHLFLGLGLAVLLRLNKVAVILGSQISIPPVAPLLGFASVQLGSLVLYGERLHLSLDDFALARLPQLAWTFLFTWALGGVMVGVVLAIPAFAVTALVVRRRRSRNIAESDWEQDRIAALRRYQTSDIPRHHLGYLRWKSRMDPVYRQVASHLGARERVLDLGTGLGFLPVLLAHRGQAREVIGLDWDERKLSSGRRAAADLPVVQLIPGDVREAPLPVCDAVVLIDVLHYYSMSVQREILTRAIDALQPGGLVLLRDTDRQARSGLTRVIERLAVQLGWNRAPSLCYRTAEELHAELSRLGLTSTSIGSSSWLHRGNLLLLGKKPS